LTQQFQKYGILNDRFIYQFENDENLDTYVSNKVNNFLLLYPIVFTDNLGLYV